MRILWIVALVVCLPIKAQSDYSCLGKNDYYIKIDSALSHKADYKRSLEVNIQTLRDKLAKAKSNEETYLINKLLYDAYRTYVSDSALAYLNRNYQLAKRYKNKDWLTETLVNEAYVYAATGWLDEAERVLKEAAGYPMNKTTEVAYYIQRVYLLNHLDNYLSTDHKYEIAQLCDSIIVLNHDPLDNAYLWARFWRDHDTKRADEVETLIKNKLSSGRGMDAQWYGNLTFALSMLYHSKGDITNFVKYITLSAINDIQMMNRDVPSLQLLAVEAFNDGDIHHAYSFLKYGFESHAEFPERVRASTLLGYMQQIYDKTQEKYAVDRKFKQRTIVILVVMSVILLLALIYIYILLRKQVVSRRQLQEQNRALDSNVEELEKVYRQLEEANEKLKLINGQVTHANALLTEANFVKEEYIGNLFTICSGYITKMDELRKTTFRKLQVKQYNELMNLAENSNSFIHDEIQELYKIFDVTFLKIYPDFLEDFNSLLRPEERLVLKKGELMNNDLRIYALVRLGINNSTKIAEFLHISTQTVYNSRMKMRNKAIVSDEEFSNRVKLLGNLSA